MLLHGAGLLLLCFAKAHRSPEISWKPLRAMNLEMVEICRFGKNVLLHIRVSHGKMMI